MKKITFNQVAGSLLKPLQHNGITYSFYRKLEKYPYIILTGLSNYTYIKQFCMLVVPAFIEIFFGMGLFTLVLIYISRKKIIKLGKASDKAKEEFIALVNQKLQIHMDAILQYSDILIRFFKGKIAVGINEARQIEFMSLIHEAALNIKNLTSNTLELTMIDLNAVIKHSISIHHKTLLQRNISIKVNLEPSLPFLEADELCVKQIVVGLLSYSLNCIPTGSDIWVSTYLQILNNQKMATLLIRDNGFGLSESDIIRINEKFEKSCIDGGMDLNFGTIVELIKLHNGIYEVENIEGEGRAITVLFPVPENYPLKMPFLQDKV